MTWWLWSVDVTDEAIGDLETMSRRWFSVEDVVLTSALDGRSDGLSLMVHAESAENTVRIWDGGDPVRAASGRPVPGPGPGALRRRPDRRPDLGGADRGHRRPAAAVIARAG